MTVSTTQIAQHYSEAMDALCEIGKAYTNLGKLSAARRVFQSALALTELDEAQPQNRLQLLLQYERMLIVALLVNPAESESVFSIIEEAKEIAEATQDKRSIAETLSLLGQAHYFATIVSNNFLDTSKEKYREALDYQQQALDMRETLKDTRGISESHFCIGNVYERWQQLDLALEHYTKARQIAEQYGHLYERAEPTRHLALFALQKGDLDQALQYGLQALSFREEAQFKPYLPLDHVLLSTVYLAKGDTDKASFHARKGLDLGTEIGSRGAIVLSLLSLGDIQVAQKEREQARADYEKAMAVAQESQSALLLGMVNANLARFSAES